MKHSESFHNDPVMKQVRADSSFRAFKVLVDTENTLRAAHNRIRVLEVNEIKNQQKIQQQLETIERIERARQAQHSHLALVEQSRLKLRKELSDKGLRSETMKSQHIRIKKEACEKLQTSKKQQYVETQEQSEQAAEAISHSRGLQKYLREEARSKVNQREQEARKKVLQYYETKQSRIREQKAGEVEGLRSKEAAQQRRLEELGKLEMQLVARQSQSRVACQEAKRKLESMMLFQQGRNTLHCKQPPKH